MSARVTGWLAPDHVWETARDEALVGDPYDPEAPYVPLHRKSFRGTDHPQPSRPHTPGAARTDKPDDVTSSASSGPCPSNESGAPLTRDAA